MTNVPNPWDNNGPNPWNNDNKSSQSPQKTKIVNFEKVTQNGDFGFNWKWGALILVLIWLASGFY